jgi:hypothetical protein
MWIADRFRQADFEKGSLRVQSPDFARLSAAISARLMWLPTMRLPLSAPRGRQAAWATESMFLEISS